MLSAVCVHRMDHLYGALHEHQGSLRSHSDHLLHFRLLPGLQPWLQRPDLQYVSFPIPSIPILTQTSISGRAIPLHGPLTRSLLVPVLRPWCRLLRHLREPHWSGAYRLEVAPGVLLLAGL